MSIPPSFSGHPPRSSPAPDPRGSGRVGLDLPLGGEVRHAGWWLLGITALGALLRLAGLGSELWIDEIGTVFDVRSHTLTQLVTSFSSANRHLLNSLAIAAATAVAGDADWVVRLPAALCGIASVPASYLLSRSALGSRESLLVALLLATSYHHIFFSQNARGYTGLLLGSMLATACLVRGLAGGERRWWWGYLGSMLFAFAALPLADFMYAAQVLVVLAYFWRRRPPRSQLRPAVGFLAAAGLVGALLDAPALAHAMSYAASVYRTPGFGARLFSAGNLGVWIQGLAGGARASGIVIFALAALLLAGGAGWLVYLRRQPWTSWLLVSPLLLEVAVVAAAGLQTSPRFFLWAVPVALFHAVAIAALFDSRPRARGRGRAALVTTAILVAISAALLLPYYRTPKQPTRQSMEWLTGRLQPREVVVAIYLAKWGARYYGPALGLQEGRDLFVVHTPSELDELEHRFGERHLRIVTTFDAATRTEYPVLFQRIEASYPVERRFRGLLDDADVRLRRWRGLVSSPPAAD
jgi:4-amino-4-deoxy-L-arabinose transferase-like glycosyltransferase